ncbi:DUF192 domain-containing protein [Poriferisphaera sp. WC338]|uniref:DUF192 domain-containing protein n=1 Tax=Poriferisphaera sp. WC338 TaxID=3425129 RepID=UPI003D8150EE
MLQTISIRIYLNMPYVLLTFLLLGLMGCSASQVSSSNSVDITLRGRQFQLELALTQAARFKGLSDRASIPENTGMLFVFPQADYRGFVMRRCLVPIDLIYLDPNGRIIGMYAMTVEPAGTPEAKLKVYASRYPAQFAIELAGGEIKKLGLEEGEKVDLPLKELKERAR